MVPTLFFYELGLVALVWVFLMLYCLWPHDSAALESAVMLARATLEEPTAAVAWADGQAMTLEQVVTYALQSPWTIEWEPGADR